MTRKHRLPIMIFAICMLVAILASLITWFDGLQIYELTTVDGRFGLRYWIKSRFHKIDVSDQVRLVAIDQKSVQPAYSDFSDRWGMGGWLTRDLWIQGVLQLADYYKPSVVAYDVVFIPYRTNERNAELFQQNGIEYIEKTIRQSNISFKELANDEKFPRLKVLDLVDKSGSGTLTSRFYDVEQAALAGKKVPAFVMAYDFTSEKEDTAKPWNPSEKQDRENIELLKRLAIPSPCIRNIPSDYPYWENVEMPFESLLEAPVHLGFINVPRDQDGNIRRIPLVVGFRDPTQNNAPVFVPSLALKSCLLYLGIDLNSLKDGQEGERRTGMTVNFGKGIHLWNKDRDIHIPIDRYGNLFLNFDGRINDFSPVSYADINRYGPLNANGELRTDLLPQQKAFAEQIKKHIQNKILLLGITFTGGTDVGPCAIDTNTPLALIHLTAIDNILRGNFLSPLNRCGSLLLLWFLLAMVGVLNWTSKVRINAVGTLILLAGYLVAGGVLFYFNIACLPMVVPVLAILVAFGGVSLFRYRVEQKARLDIRKKFSTMVSGSYLEYLEDNPESFALTGERKEVTILFSDVVGFTSISERLPPDQLVKVVNSYLTPMTEIILHDQGYLDKYLGDGIMAFWGAPKPGPDHAFQACEAALRQQAEIRKMVPMFKEQYQIDLKVRMGINSGWVDAGNMGSSERFQYTVMGDAVNLAARLEPANKDYMTDIIIGENTFRAIQARGLVTRLLDRIVVQGKTKPTEIYQLVGRDNEVSSADKKALELFEKGLRLHWQRHWEEAFECFDGVLKALPTDAPALMLRERVRYYQSHPPVSDWQGEHIRLSKN